MRDGNIFKNSHQMFSRLCHCAIVIATVWLTLGAGPGYAQSQQDQEDEPLGPVVTAYLGYLRNEQEVVDDRVSRREISRAYYRRNSNRIRVLREVAIRIARQTGNDYLPELEAVTRDELGTLFERPPNVSMLSVGKILNDTFRFVGSLRSGEMFHVFARLDPYEQAELKLKGAGVSEAQPRSTKPGTSVTRPRRATRP